MEHDDPEPDGGLFLTCTECGESLSPVPEAADQLECPEKHRFTLPDLLLAQAARASALLEAGLDLLQEQEALIREIAKQLRSTQSRDAFKLEGSADRLKEMLAAVRKILEEGMRPPKGGSRDDQP